MNSHYSNFSKNSQEDSGGNTSPQSPIKKQVPSSKRWCFTLNNHTISEKDEIVRCLEINSYLWIIGIETGELGTPHLQGYCEFKKAIRPTLFKNKRIHFEKAKGTREQNIKYCSKEGNVISHGIPKPIQIIENLYKWQQEVVDIIKKEPNDRSIYWFWDETGNIGKTALAKYLVVKYDAVVVSGRAQDVKYVISMRDIPPEIIIWDIPRSLMNAVSYSGMEEIKNGLFCNSKYESKMVVMNSPHIICFANTPPITENMSLDRWIIKEVTKEG